MCGHVAVVLWLSPSGDFCRSLILFSQYFQGQSFLLSSPLLWSFVALPFDFAFVATVVVPFHLSPLPPLKFFRSSSFCLCLSERLCSVLTLRCPDFISSPRPSFASSSHTVCIKRFWFPFHTTFLQATLFTFVVASNTYAFVARGRA